MGTRPSARGMACHCAQRGSLVSRRSLKSGAGAVLRCAPWRAAPCRPGRLPAAGQQLPHPFWEGGARRSGERAGGPACKGFGKMDGERGGDMGCVEARVAAGEQHASRGATEGRATEKINRRAASGCCACGPRATGHVPPRALVRGRRHAVRRPPVGGVLGRANAEAAGRARAFMARTSKAGPRTGALRPRQAQSRAAASRAHSWAGSRCIVGSTWRGRGPAPWACRSWFQTSPRPPDCASHRPHSSL